MSERTVNKAATDYADYADMTGARARNARAANEEETPGRTNRCQASCAPVRSPRRLFLVRQRLRRWAPGRLVPVRSESVSSVKSVAKTLRFAVIMAACLTFTASAAQWREAAPGYAYAFPRDHASHPEYKIEWWYYTGNVAAKDGRRFGYQVTFFRVGINAAPPNPSRWAVRDLFMAHLAVSDPSGKRYRYAERLSRGGPGLAGADTDRYHVWNDDWTRLARRAEPSRAARVRQGHRPSTWCWTRARPR